MMNRRTVLAAAACSGALAASGMALAAPKGKRHENGQALLGAKIKQNGKHKIHTAGKSEVFADVKDGKVVGLAAAGAQVKKVKSRKKFADNTGFVRVADRTAQVDVWYYGYWVDEPTVDYYYWFPVDVIIIDSTWIEISF